MASPPDERNKKKDPTLGEALLGLGALALGTGGAVYGAYKGVQWLMSGSREDHSDEVSGSQEYNSHEESMSSNNPKNNSAQEPGLSRSNIGVNFNDWRKPTNTFGNHEPDMEHKLDVTFGKFNLGRKEWTRARDIVNTVLDMMFAEIKKESSKFEGLIVERFIKQGSSREGLKVGDADEFDTLLKYHIQGLHFNARAMQSGGCELPELIHLLISDPPHKLQSRYKRLYEHKPPVFYFENGSTYLNARVLHERVFTSIIDKARDTICGKVNKPENEGKFEFKINRRQNPPSINIIIELMEDDEFDGVRHLRQVRGADIPSAGAVLEQSLQTTTIDVDIVPGLLLQDDLVPDPTQRGQTIKCPRYAVCKWVTDNHSSASRYSSPQLVWRNCSSGYEKHVLDVAQGHTEQRYIITAVRIAKMYFRWAKKNCYPPPQIASVLRSYHLKHLGIYCILYLRILKRVPLTGVRHALAYLLDFLQVCLEEERLPHFFQGNNTLLTMFPYQQVSDGALRYDLFTNKSGDALLQARRSLRVDMRTKLSSFYDEDDVDRRVVEKFRDYVTSGNYSVQ